MATLPVTPKKECKKIISQSEEIDGKRNFCSIISAIQYPRCVVLWKEFMQFVSIIVIFSCKSLFFL